MSQLDLHSYLNFAPANLFIYIHFWVQHQYLKFQLTTNTYKQITTLHFFHLVVGLPHNLEKKICLYFCSIANLS